MYLDGKHFCGCNTNLKISTNFGTSNSKTILFKTFKIDNQIASSETGFAIEVTQEECFEKQNKIIWPETTQEASIQRLDLIGTKRVLGTQNSADTADPYTSKKFYFFAESNTTDFPVSPEYELVELLKSVTSSGENACLIRPTTSFLNKLASSGAFCSVEKMSENLFLFKKHFGSSPSNTCVDLGYRRGYFRSPWYPFFYPSGLSQCYR